MSTDAPPGPVLPRLVAVWVPDWPVVALTLEARERRSGRSRGEASVPDPALEPVAVIGGRGVVAASAPARAAGVRVGMRLRVARSLCTDLVVLHPRPEREARAFETVMDCLSQVLADPLVIRPGLAVCGARGPARWVGGEEELAEALVEAVAQGSGAECQVGVADSLPAAVLAARRGCLVAPGHSPEFLAPWPLEAALSCLPTSRQREEARDLIEVLARLGLHTLGDLAALPRRDVSARFGPVGEHLHRLAAAAPGPVPRTTRPATDVSVDSVLDPPVARADAAAFAARTLAESLADRLVSRGLAAGRLLVEARCEDGAELARSWMLETTPTPAELTDRVRWQLEGWLAGRSGRAPASPLAGLRLSALELVPAGASQVGLWSAPGDRSRRRARRAAERVESLLGAGALQTPLVVEGRDPRSRARMLDWDAPAPPVGRGAPWTGSLPEPSPSLILPRPLPALLEGAPGQEVGVSAEGQLEADPALLTVLPDPGEPGGVPAGSGPGAGWSQGVVPPGGTRVLAWAGPWAMDECWWRPAGPSRRAYLQVLTEEGPRFCSCVPAGGGSRGCTPDPAGRAPRAQPRQDTDGRRAGRRRSRTAIVARATRHSQATPIDQPARTSVSQW